MQTAPIEAYEYKVMPLDGEHLSKPALDKVGREGWVLVATIPQLVFMRRLTSGTTVHDLFGKRLLTVKEAADYLGLSRSKTYALIYSGQIKGLKIGRSMRITREAMEIFIRSQG